MAVVTPFRALRYHFSKAGAPETVCCPPYDIIPDPSVWTGKSPRNAIFLEGGERLGTADPYRDAKETLDSWLAAGFLREDDAPAFYLYEVTFKARGGEERVLRGLAALLKLSPFSEGIVLPHEFTLSAAKEDRRLLMRATGCQFSAIYGLYNDPEGRIAKLLTNALGTDADTAFDTDDGLRHSLRVLSDEATCAALTDAFRDKQIFIADGHHRYETLLKLQEDAGTPGHAMIFLADMNDAGVEMWETHRVVGALEDYREEALKEALEERFILTEGSRPERGEFVWITGTGSYRLKPKKPSGEKSAVASLHNELLEPLLGIDAAKLANQTNLSYTRDAREAERLVRSGAAQCAFLLPEAEMGELRDTVLAGEKMPQKSTYFYPKVITGLFMAKFS
ncbi:MAG: DUF1015 domain-containing protein [Oscillospiraceae bacterium]|jgi:uncharacterized protein (DUF1015 family)|nr:DUF1015 domain-containing protein [Oscillospiraceae bacterium]